MSRKLYHIKGISQLACNVQLESVGGICLCHQNSTKKNYSLYQNLCYNSLKLNKTENVWDIERGLPQSVITSLNPEFANSVTVGKNWYALVMQTTKPLEINTSFKLQDKTPT